jgi:acyl-CoA thioester hydrolase
MTTHRDNVDGGLFVAEGRVRPEWIDINGHMNVAYYVLAFDYGVDALWAHVGITDAYINERKLSTFAVESHVIYRAELKLDDPYRVETRLLAVDSKRVHQFQRMFHATDGFLAATAEWLNLHVDLRSRRVCAFPDDVLQGFVDVAKRQRPGPLPVDVGKQMRIGSPLFAVDGYA